MAAQIETSLECPYCGEPITLLIDPSVPQQHYIEDCQVCCQPMAVYAEIDPDGEAQVTARREDGW
jgi:hypothetical protein